MLAAVAAACALGRGSVLADVDAGAGRQPPVTRQAQVKEPEVDPHSVSADARRSSREFWAKLPAEKKTALERDLDKLEGRARRGEAVDKELSQLRARYPGLSQAEAALGSARWITAGGSTQAFVCNGMVLVGRNGRTRCIGHFSTAR